MSDDNPKHLLYLPPELRFMIYDYVFGDDPHLVSYSCGSCVVCKQPSSREENICQAPVWKGLDQESISLLKTCSLIHRESKAVFWARFRLCLTVLASGLKIHGNGLPYRFVSMRPQLQNLTVAVLEYYRDDDRESFYSMYNRYPVLHQLSQYLSLRKFTLAHFQTHRTNLILPWYLKSLPPFTYFPRGGRSTKQKADAYQHVHNVLHQASKHERILSNTPIVQACLARWNKLIQHHLKLKRQNSNNSSGNHPALVDEQSDDSASPSTSLHVQVRKGMLEESLPSHESISYESNFCWFREIRDYIVDVGEDCEFRRPYTNDEKMDLTQWTGDVDSISLRARPTNYTIWQADILR